MATDPRPTRRRFLEFTAATIMAATGPPAAAGSPRAEKRRHLYASCGADGQGGYFVAVLDPGGRIVFRRPLAERGHHIALCRKKGVAAVPARRPGTSMLFLDLATGDVVDRIEASPDRHFYGHGVFSSDGRWLFATENDFGAGRGVIGIYDTADGFRRADEFASGGIGPHQLLRAPDGQSLIVANGGILTHPDTGRSKLNVQDMQPSLAVIELQSGRIADRLTLPDSFHKLSIRHIDVRRSGVVAIAMQYEGDRRHKVPLVALAAPGRELRFLGDPGAGARMRHYTGSACFDRSGRFLAVTAPRNGQVVLWDTELGREAARIDAPDASGVAPAPTPRGFFVTGGDGAIRRVDISAPASGHAGSRAPIYAPRSTILRPPGGGAWDNHLSAA